MHFLRLFNLRNFHQTHDVKLNKVLTYLAGQARSPFVLKHTTSWRASEASETVLGVFNAKSGICSIYIYIYIFKDCTYAPQRRARGLLFSQKTRLLRLYPSFLRYYSIKQVLLYICFQNCEKTPSKTLVFEVSKVVATGYYDVDDPLPS